MRIRAAILASTLALLLMAAGHAPAHAKCALPHVLSNGEVPDADKMMANFNALVACLAVAGSANAIQYNAGSGSLGAVGPLADGQLAIGSTGAAPQAQTLTAGTGISIANASGSITVAATAGTAGTGIYRQVMSATPTAASTGLGSWVNQGSSVVSDSPVGITIDAPSSATANLSGRYVVAPTAPYTLTALVSATRTTPTGGSVGIGWYDGSSKLQGIYIFNNINAPYIAVRCYASPTVLSTVNFTSNLNGFSMPVWFRITDDGTNVTFAFGYDGANFLTVYSTTKSAGFLGASGYSNLLFFVDPGSGSHTFGMLLSWTQS